MEPEGQDSGLGTRHDEDVAKLSGGECNSRFSHRTKMMNGRP